MPGLLSGFEAEARAEFVADYKCLVLAHKSQNFKDTQDVYEIVRDLMETPSKDSKKNFLSRPTFAFLLSMDFVKHYAEAQLALKIDKRFKNDVERS